MPFFINTKKTNSNIDAKHTTMAVQTSKNFAVTLTDGSIRNISGDTVTYIKAKNGGGAYLTYLRDKDTITAIETTTAASAINTACGRTQLVEQVGEQKIYIHSDKIVLIDPTDAGCDIVYDDFTANSPAVLYTVENASNVSNAAGNTFRVPQQAEGNLPAKDIYLNCHNVGALRVNTSGSGITLRGATVIQSGSGGTSYVVGDTIVPDITAETLPIMTVSYTQLRAGAIDVNGNGYAPGDKITLAGGTSVTKAYIAVDTVDGGGGVTAFTIQSGGQYTINANSLTQFSTTGGGTGFEMDTTKWGVYAVVVTDGGIMEVAPSNPLVQDSSSGAGVGATFNGTFITGTVTDCAIMYDMKKTGWKEIFSEDTVAQTQTAINAL